MLIKVKFKKLNDLAEIPKKAIPTDFCYDCVATSCEEIHPGVYKYGLGFALQIQEDEKGCKCSKSNIYGIELSPRSSIHKTGLILSNGEGKIDYDYTGEISAVFYHVIPSLPIYKVGDRICQISIMKTVPMDFNIFYDLDETVRGSGGFGHTGT